MRRAIRVTVLSALLLATPAAAAQALAPSSFEERTGWPLPQSGIYFDPAQPGVGFSFDVGLDGTVLGGFASYGADGRSIFYTLQGRIARDEQAPATIGVLRSPVYLSRQLGTPGSAAAQVVTDTVPALGEAVVRFTEARRLTVEIAGQRWNMQRLALTEDPAQWVAGRFLLLVEPRAGDSLTWPVLAQVSIGMAQAVPVRAGAPEGGCGVATPPSAAREVVCETGCGAFQEWAGGRTARVLTWPNADSSTWQLGRFVPGNDGQWLPLPGADQHTLETTHLSLDALPVARGCTGKSEPLRFYRRDVPRKVVQTPVGPATVRYALGSLRAGTWWDPTRPGRGLVIDVGGRTTQPLATGMVGVFDFRADGSADFSTLEGIVQSPNPGMLWTEVLESPIYTHRDGQCIGCPWRAPTTSAGGHSLQLFFDNGNFGVLTVRRLLGSVELERTRYERFPIDRSPFDEVRGRWLLRIQDKALTGTSTEFATLGQPIPAFAEVVIEPLADADTSPGFGFSPLYRVACVAGCGDFERWKALAGRAADPAPREVVLWFDRSRAVGVEEPLDPATGRLAVFRRNGRELALVGGAQHTLDLLARDRYSTTYPSVGLDGQVGSSTIDLFRNPPRVLAD